jgi:hypothetical protein
MNTTIDDATRDRTFWRGMYLIAFVIGVVVPIAAGAATSETAWRRQQVAIPLEEARGRVDVQWRTEMVYEPPEKYDGGPLQSHMEYRAYEYRQVEGSLLLLGFAWSGATLIGIAGLASGAWIVMVTGEKLGIDRGRGYLRGMFLMAFATGALVPLAGIIASGVTTSESPTDIADEGTILLVVMWSGMLAVCITGVFAAAWLVKTAAAKLGHTPLSNQRLGVYEPRYATEVESVR